ncbi:MAG: hypothetical protein Q9163_000984 [Psora crenata]
MRLNVDQVVKYVMREMAFRWLAMLNAWRDKNGSLIHLSYNGVVDITPEVAAILGGSPDARSTEFGDSFIEMKFETGDEKFKDLELKMFVGAGRFIVEQGRPVTVEYKVSKVVRGR